MIVIIKQRTRTVTMWLSGRPPSVGRCPVKCVCSAEQHVIHPQTAQLLAAAIIIREECGVETNV